MVTACTTESRAVASNVRDPSFESSHHNLYKNVITIKIRCKQLKKGPRLPIESTKN